MLACDKRTCNRAPTETRVSLGDLPEYTYNESTIDGQLCNWSCIAKHIAGIISILEANVNLVWSIAWPIVSYTNSCAQTMTHKPTKERVGLSHTTWHMHSARYDLYCQTASCRIDLIRVWLSPAIMACHSALSVLHQTICLAMLSCPLLRWPRPKSNCTRFCHFHCDYRLHLVPSVTLSSFDWHTVVFYHKNLYTVCRFH